jgi:hypothetical protein
MCAVSGRPRDGVTLPGVLVGLSLAALVLALLGGAMVTLLRQAHRQHDRTQARGQLAHAVGVLAAELRTVAAAPSTTDVGDLLLVADTALDVRAAVGGGAACTVASDAVELVDVAVAGAPFVSWWSDAPQRDDVVHLHDEGPSPAIADDAWIARDVVGVEFGGGACAVGPLAQWTTSALRLRVGGPALPTTLGAGAPVRVTRRRRYALYRAGDGSWQMGQRSWSAGVASLQPIAGPLNSAAAADPGLQVTALAADGTPIAGAPPPSPVARLSIVARAERSWAGRRWLDSAVAHLPLDAGSAP